MSEEITERYHIRRREFLNENPEWPGFIIGVVEDTRQIPDDDPKRSWNDGYVMLDLADCNRRVSFDFGMNDDYERAKSLSKINLIADIVNAVRDAIALEIESINARPVAPPAEVEEVPTQEVEKRVQFSTPHIITLGL